MLRECTLRIASAAINIGCVDNHLPVEAAGPQQCAIEHVGTVGRGQQDYAHVGFKAIHLDEQLIERLLTLVVYGTDVHAPLAADRVQFIDEDDAGRLSFRLLEQVAHPRGADTDEHFDKIAAAERKERNLGFAGHRPGQQGLAGAGGSDQQHPFGNAWRPGLRSGSGFLRKSTTSCSSYFASSQPATSLKLTFVCLSATS